MDKNTRFLVTGCAGFMGSWVAENLLSKGFKNIYGVDNLSGGHRENINHLDIKFTELDLADATKTWEYVHSVKPEIVFHLAASAHEGASGFFPQHILKTNYQAFVNLIVPSIKYGVKHFINYSTMAVYGNQVPPFSEEMKKKPVDVYGINKSAMEDTLINLAELHEFKYTIIRPHNVIGVRQSLCDSKRNVAAIFMNRIMRGEPIIIYGDGQQKRSFSGIDYSLECYTNCLNLKTNEIVNIGGKYPTTINELAYEVIEAMDVRKDYPIKHITGRPFEVKYAWTTYQKSEDLLGYSEPQDGWRLTIRKMAKWALSKGAQEWMPISLELINHKTPKTWLPDFNPHTI